MDEALARAEQAVDPFDTMNIIYTSGTTGFPTGGLSMHRNNMACIYNTTARMGLHEGDRSLLNLPLFSNFGCMYVAGLSFLRGAAVVMKDFARKLLHPRHGREGIDLFQSVKSKVPTGWSVPS